MSRRVIRLAAAAMILVAAASVAAARAGPLFGLSGPSDDGAAPVAPPAGHDFDLGGPRSEDAPPGGRNKPVQPHDELDDKAAEAPHAPPTHKDMLDRLFARLAKAEDPDEASGIATLIERVWMDSGSDTADLLMSRAVEAMASSHRDVALSLLDQVIVLDPDWAEAWNKRATLRFLENDDAGAMEDIGHTLLLEPRHYGALSGMGFILKRNGLGKGALTALRRAESLYPENPDIRKAVDQLVPEVEGTDL